MSMPEEEVPSSAVRTPPYVAYKTLLTLIEDLKTNGLPPQIDRSVLKRFSGGVGAQLLMSLRSLGLITEQNQPTQLLASLVREHGGAGFAPAMKEALRVGYPFLRGMDLMTATPSMFGDAFKVTGAKEDVLRKCRRFYLQAAADVGIPLGPRLANGGGNSAPRSSSPGNAAPRANSARRRSERRRPSERTPSNTPSLVVQTIEQQLVGKFPDFDPSWDDNIKKAWFEGFKDLMNSTVKKEDGGT